MSLPDVYLTRVYSDDNVTRGLLTYGEWKVGTLELPWKNNARNISCIPTGKYEVIRRDPSPSFDYEHFILKDVPDRSWILIHRGNTPEDTAGCILVGRHIEHSTFIASSKVTLDLLVEELPKAFNIHVIDAT